MSDPGIYQALARTALLIDLDIFGPGADHHRIIDGLRATTARIIADRANLASPAGQTALVTLYAQLAMMGVQIDLDVPAVGLLIEQPPLRSVGDLPSALLDYSADLLPGGSARPDRSPDITFTLGDTPGPDGAVCVTGTGWTAALSQSQPGPRWRGNWPAGAMAASAAAAADGLRAAIPRIADHLGQPVPTDPRWLVRPDRHVQLDLRRYRVDGPATLGEIDVISGGAITNAALYALFRIPAATATIRVIEPETLDVPNLNRYALARWSMNDWQKTQALASFQTPRIRITGTSETFSEATAPGLAPLAPRLLVGVDHIPSRWAAQQAATSRWVCVGSSSHDFVLVSAHPAGSACAGCVHTHDDDTTGDIPTISFVSFWAGLIQALELITDTAGKPAAWTRATHIWPFGLDNPRGIHPFTQHPIATCPLGCPASAALPAA